MKGTHIKVFTGSPLLVRRLRSILEAHNIPSLSKSDKIVGYEISNHIDELYVLSTHLEKAAGIVADYEKEIAI